MNTLPEAATRVIVALEKSRRPLLTSHIRLDGDAIGSELGLAHILKARGAEPRIVNDGPVPEVYRFLPGAEEVGARPDAIGSGCDLAVCLDMALRKRAGSVIERLPRDLPVVSIDHHPFIERVGEPEWRDDAMSSTGEMIHQLAAAAGWKVFPEAATCLYAAILTDTGRFCFPNTTPSALRAAASLMESGADTVRIAEHVYEHEPTNVMALRAETMQRLSLHAEGRIAAMTITREMLDRHKVKPVDLHAFSDIPRSIAGVDVGVLLREMNKKVKVSLRSHHGVDVTPIARQFGGGGHAQAAGCEIPGTLEAAQEAVLKAIQEHLNEKRP